MTKLDTVLARQAFESLSRTSREVLELRYVEGLGFLELSDLLGITPVAARQRAHRAREELIGLCIERTAEGGFRTCRPVRSKLGRFLRGQLSRKVRAQISSHLATCTSCADCYEQLRDQYGDRFASPGADS